MEGASPKSGEALFESSVHLRAHCFVLNFEVLLHAIVKANRRSRLVRLGKARGTRGAKSALLFNCFHFFFVVAVSSASSGSCWHCCCCGFARGPVIVVPLLV